MKFRNFTGALAKFLNFQMSSYVLSGCSLGAPPVCGSQLSMQQKQGAASGLRPSAPSAFNATKTRRSLGPPSFQCNKNWALPRGSATLRRLGVKTWALPRVSLFGSDPVSMTGGESPGAASRFALWQQPGLDYIQCAPLNQAMFKKAALGNVTHSLRSGFFDIPSCTKYSR